MKTLSNQSLLSSSQTDPALDELVREAQALFQALDNTSAKIRDLENKLGKIKAHFPFSYPVHKEQVHDALSTDATDLHKQKAEFHTYLGYNTYVEWHLSWEEEDNKSQNFRLFLISRRQEFTLVEGEEHPIESYYPLVDQVISKIPLIETNLPTRLKFAEYLQIFIKRFQEHLQRYRISIEGQQLDSVDDGVPF